MRIKVASKVHILKGILFLAILGLLSGCFAVDSQKDPQELIQSSGKVKVLLAASQNRYYGYSAQSFFTKMYSEPFQSIHSDIQIELISLDKVKKNPSGELDLETIRQLIADEHPDLIYMNSSQYEQLTTDNKLTLLDANIEQGEFDMNAFYPPVLEALNRGGYYGLSPSFDSLALFYNKSIFDSKSIAYPKEGMTWEEWFRLVAQFSVHEADKARIYGIYQPPYSRLSGLELIRFIGESMGLPKWKEESDADMNEWIPLLDRFASLYHSGSIAPPEARQLAVSASDHGNDKFMQGAAAMTFAGSDFFRNLLDVRRDREAFNDWGVVSLPILADNPKQTLGFTAYEIYGIPLGAKKSAAAWQLIQYICGDDRAKLAMEPPFRYFSSNRKQWQTINLAPFTELIPDKTKSFFNSAEVTSHQEEQHALEAIKEEGNGWSLLSLFRNSYR
ncbi:ABC transporter substrate-binding protein [Paenibacillus psychroresistens]|nr:ABC transporter substrate-binding protein [Paenibacillus psychroresistens]